MKILNLKNDIAVPFVLSVFFVYLTTICPAVYVGDSGELTTAAFSLGIPHPSGYPLFSMLGKLFCLIPFGSIAYRLNFMSVFFSVAAIWIVYSIINKLTGSVIASISASLALAFTALFWGQTISAEVYPLHVFFVALLISILLYYNDSENVRSLLILAFVLGLSFCNHLQTLMIVPSFIIFILMSGKRTSVNLRLIIFCSILFLFSLTIYVYLPIRTHAGSAIHWGDPDNIERFLAVVTGKGHREEYVFNSGFLDYVIRTKEAAAIVIKQYGLILLISFWGFIVSKTREKLFFSSLIFFDFFYTVFLNTVNIEITPFNLVTLMVLAIMEGIGLTDIIKRLNGSSLIQNNKMLFILKGAILFIPFIFLISNYSICDQSRNYTAREHAVNTLRTINNKGTLILEGDNNLFPVTYASIVDRMREDVSLYDRHNLFFKMPYMDDHKGTFVYHGKWEDLSSILQHRIIQKKVSEGVYYAVFNPYAISMPEKYYLVPYGIVSQVVSENPDDNKIKRYNIWKYYMTQSFEDNFYRDYMTREVAAHFHFCFGKELILSGNRAAGLKRMKLASRIGYDDDMIHTALAVFFIDTGLLKEAKTELEKSMLYSDDLSIVNNNWGYYYIKKDDHRDAIRYFKKAVSLQPDKVIFLNNLGYAYMGAGDKGAALDTFQKSLKIRNDQARIKKVVEELIDGK